MNEGIVLGHGQVEVLAMATASARRHGCRPQHLVHRFHLLPLPEVVDGASNHLKDGANRWDLAGSARQRREAAASGLPCRR